MSKEHHLYVFMKKVKTHQILLAAFFVVFGVFLYWLNTYHFERYQPINTAGATFEKAEVLSIMDSYLEEDDNTSSGYRGEQQLELKIKSGTYKGEVVEATNQLTKSHNVLASEGSELIICISDNNVGYYVTVYNYSKSNSIFLMLLFFAALIVLVGRLKGVKTLIGLTFSFACIIFFTLPMIYNGYSPILIAIISAILITFVSLILLEGLTKKVFVALSGTSAGVIGAGIVFKLFGEILHVSGFILDEVDTLYVIQNNTGLQIRDVLFAGVIIAATGAVMDVAMSIASSLQELHENKPDLSSGQLFRSGMNIGQDLIGTMANTLILAYAGGSFSAMILYMAYCVNYNQLINMDTLVLEITQAISGSIGIVLTVPFASLIGSRVMAGVTRSTEP